MLYYYRCNSICQLFRTLTLLVEFQDRPTRSLKQVFIKTKIRVCQKRLKIQITQAYPYQWLHIKWQDVTTGNYKYGGYLNNQIIGQI